MLSPHDISPKGKAPSIWSFDSGYGSNTVEEDDLVDLHQLSQPDLSTEKKPVQQSIGLGISGLDVGAFWNIQFGGGLRVRRSEATVVPVTTRLNVFTTRDTSTTNLPVPTTSNDVSACVTCHLWNLTNPGEGLRCADCKSKDAVKPEAHLSLTESKSKQAAPRLIVPQGPRRRQSFKSRNQSRCTACDLAYAIDPNTSAACPSCAPSPGLLSPDGIAPSSTVRRSCARRYSKLPPHALRQLRAWLSANRDHPYPSSDTKRALADECGITEKQVTTWFTNTRARKLPLLKDVSHASSGDEGAYESDFSNVANTPSNTTSPVIRYDTPSGHSYILADSEQPHLEHGQSALQTARRGKKKDYRRMHTISPIDDSPMLRAPMTPSPNPSGQEQETWQCTFCRQSLAPKSWRRHEETQHRPKYQWTCLATNPRLKISDTTSICAFCQLENPTEEHFLTSHRIVECSSKCAADRTFGRPDHLRQHMKNFHKTALLPLVRDRWRSLNHGYGEARGFQCGFCKVHLDTWDMRQTHIANHFKDGKTMADWHDDTLDRIQTHTSLEHSYTPPLPLPLPIHHTMTHGITLPQYQGSISTPGLEYSHHTPGTNPALNVPTYPAPQALSLPHSPVFPVSDVSTHMPETFVDPFEVEDPLTEMYGMENEFVDFEAGEMEGDGVGWGNGNAFGLDFGGV